MLLLRLWLILLVIVLAVMLGASFWARRKGKTPPRLLEGRNFWIILGSFALLIVSIGVLAFQQEPSEGYYTSPPIGAR